MMIGAKIMLEDDREVASVYLRVKPAIGEYLWLGSAEKFGASSFRIVDVAHWLSTEWSPNTHTGDPIHNLAIYVEPMPPGAPV